jgi:hypothetical protein
MSRSRNNSRLCVLENRALSIRNDIVPRLGARMVKERLICRSDKFAYRDTM